MSKIDSSGQAFPSHPILYSSADAHQAQGMSLRDWFAGQALAGMFRHDGWINTVDGSQSEVAFRAYAIADAMLSARSNRGEEDNG